MELDLSRFCLALLVLVFEACGSGDGETGEVESGESVGTVAEAMGGAGEGRGLRGEVEKGRKGAVSSVCMR